ncbi:TolC family protein [Altibacter sp.]|uniref:TolC family protein n=1 Tax=Altibacter sp. TaxID=2024823 RepID=UPI000C8FD9DE|nr:TolC family protein [Altibacter sp.]MAP53539.1 transporter [Altibacter sp.]
MKKLKLLLFSILLFPSEGHTQELTSYIQTALANNPEIQVVDMRYALAEEKVNETNSLPNTELTAGYFISEPETRTGAQRARFSLRQMIPWFGTLTARETYAASMAEAQYVDIAIAKRKLALEVAQGYYTLFALKEKQLVLLENIRLLQTYEQLALTSVEVGTASAVDVLRLQIRQNELQQELAVLQEQTKAQEAMFNNMLHRTEDSTVEITDTLSIPSEVISVEPTQLELHPELLRYDALYESVVQAEQLNRKEAAPSLGFGLDYIPVSNRSDMNVSENGKDILMPMLTVSVPIFSKKYTSVSKQNQLRQQELIAQKETRQNVLDNLVRTAISNRNSAVIRYRTQMQNLAQAKDAEEILLKNYETGTIDFTDVLDIQELQLMFQKQIIESITDFHRQTALMAYVSPSN